MKEKGDEKDGQLPGQEQREWAWANMRLEKRLKLVRHRGLMCDRLSAHGQ